MTPGFPGLCVRCGGPQWWTEVDGVVWVACKADCVDDQLDFFEARLPPLIALGERPEDGTEHPKEGGGKAP